MRGRIKGLTFKLMALSSTRRTTVRAEFLKIGVVEGSGVDTSSGSDLAMSRIADFEEILGFEVVVGFSKNACVAVGAFSTIPRISVAAIESLSIAGSFPTIWDLSRATEAFSTTTSFSKVEEHFNTTGFSHTNGFRRTENCFPGAVCPSKTSPALEEHVAISAPVLNKSSPSNFPCISIN